VAELRTAGSITGRALAVLVWIFMTWLMIGTAEWDGRADPGDAKAVAMMLCTAVGSAAFLAGALTRPPAARRIALAALVGWLVTLVLLYS
jgi:hypothetical protein